MDYDEATKFLESLDVRDLESAIAAGLDTGQAFDAAISLAVTGHILAATSAEDLAAEEEDAVSDWVNNDGTYAVEAALGRDVLTCGNPSGLYELWGLRAVELSGSWYVYDYGEAEQRFRLWAKSSSHNDSALVEAAVNAWSLSFEEIGLPPFMGECWDGDASIALAAVESLIQSSDTAWGYFAQDIPELTDEAIAELPSAVWADYGVQQPDPETIAELVNTSDYSSPPTEAQTREVLVLIYLASRRGCP